MMDKDELKDVLECEKISKLDYINAYNTANKIMDYYNSNKETFNKFIYDNFKKYNNKIKNTK